MNRTEILQTALELTAPTGERSTSYDSQTSSYANFQRIASLWTPIISPDNPITPKQVGLCMIALKLARAITSNDDDSLVDIAGYAALSTSQELTPHD